MNNISYGRILTVWIMNIVFTIVFMFVLDYFLFFLDSRDLIGNSVVNSYANFLKEVAEVLLVLKDTGPNSLGLAFNVILVSHLVISIVFSTLITSILCVTDCLRQRKLKVSDTESESY